MKRWMILFLALGTALPACVVAEKAEEKKSSKSDDDDDDEKDSKKSKKEKEKDKDDKDSDKKSSDDDKKSKKTEEVDAKKLLEDSDGSDGSAVLDVKLPDDDKKDAPSLGGGTMAAQPASSLTWISAGPLAVPNPGWKRIDDGPATVLLSPDKKAGIVFAYFTTPQDGTQKVNNVVKFFKLRDAKWKKSKQVTIGPDKISAFFGSGSAIDKDGKPTKLFFSLMKTGASQNLLAIGLADSDTPEATLKTGFNIVGSIKRK
jgi:hypothetical protein